MVDKLLLGHTVRQERSGWGRQVIIMTASAMRQPVDRVRPHPDLKGLGVTARTVSLLPLASGKQGGIHHCHTEWEPTSLTQSDHSASRRLTGCGATQPTSSLPAGYGRIRGGLSKDAPATAGEYRGVYDRRSAGTHWLVWGPRRRRVQADIVTRPGLLVRPGWVRCDAV